MSSSDKSFDWVQRIREAMINNSESDIKAKLGTALILFIRAL